MARSKRKQIDLTGLQDADSAPASWPDNIYPKKLTVTHDADMESDFSDLQLRDSDETTVLDHWIETYIADTEATVWVAVPLPSGSTSKSIYMYYDDPGAADSSDGSAVFDFFDDWSDRSVLAGTLSDNTSDPAIVNPRAIIQTPSGESRVREHSNTGHVLHVRDRTRHLHGRPHALPLQRLRH